MKVSNIEKFTKIANTIHSYKYDYSMVEYKNVNTKIKIICKEHGIFEQIPYKHLKKQGCPKCAGKINLTNDNFIKISKEIHNNKYDYSMLDYKNIKSKVKIICKEHGIFEQVAGTHIYNKSGCPRCAGKIKLTTNEFLEKSKKVHGDKYDYHLVEYKNNYTKIKIICPEHGIFEQTPNKHLNGCECQKCANNLKLNINEFIKNAKLIHDETYDYSLVEYINNRIKVKIICNKHGIFEQAPSNHISKKQGCPKCQCKSKGEKEINDFLTQNNISFEVQKRFDNCKNKQELPFDFYLPDLNLLIEFDGRQHYNINTKYYSEDIKINDNIKNNFCQNNNFNLLRIKYNENIKEKITEYLYEKI